MTIRSHLLLLAIGAVLPVLAFALFVAVVLVDQDRLTVQRGATDRARAMMTAVDAELRGSMATVKAMTASPALQADDLGAFRAEAVRVLATQPAWLDVTLAQPAGEKVVDALRPAGGLLGAVLDSRSADRAASTGQAVIGDIDQNVSSGEAAIPLRVPVLRDGMVIYILTALVRPDSFEDLIRQQRLPDGWISGIVDAGGRFVARVPSRHAGEFASPAFRAAVLQTPEGWYRGLTVEGKDTYTAHRRSEFSGWSVGLAIPADIVESAAWRTAWLMIVGVLASTAVALLITIVLGRRIARPIVSLASLARSIGEGKASADAIRDNVQEVKEVATALHDADVAVHERQLLIEREKDALEAADRAKDEFIAALSHELRNPMAALTAATHVLRIADPAHPAAGDARRVIDRQTRHMSRMVEDLLDVSRLIAGKITLTLETFDLGRLVSSTVDAWRATGRFAGQIVSVHAEPAWITADRTRMEQIVANLLDNAVKFTPPGKAIAVEVAREGDVARLSIADDGEGIAADLVGRVFDVFVQGEQGVGRSKGGMGLGLTLVKRLAELQHGSVSVASEGIGHGATFTVRMPRAAEPAAIVSITAAGRRHTLAGRVLIVEDNADARAMLREVLSMDGHVVHEAADGRSGIARANDTDPDIAIVDIGLPDIDGYEVARSIKAQSQGRTALVALTGYGQPSDQQRAMAAGFDVFLVKPISIERLDQAITVLLANAASIEAPGAHRARQVDAERRAAQ